MKLSNVIIVAKAELDEMPLKDKTHDKNEFNNVSDTGVERNGDNEQKES